MAWSEKLKLSKQLIKAVTEAGYTSPKEVQQKTLARIYGGQDVLVAGPEGCGKTTTYILAVLNRIKYNAEGVPLVLILVPTKDDVLAVISGLEHFGKNKQMSIVGLYAATGTEAQMDALADGADIVVATPDRARAIYLKLGLNLNKVELLVVDDADLIVKQGLQLPVVELANSITKCQHLVFTEVIHDRLNKMISPFMQSATTVEVEEVAESVLETHPQLLYHVPNFVTKLNLLNLFMQDSELFTKTVVFVNTRHTAEKIYKTLQNRQNNSIAILNSWSVEFNGFTDINDFKKSANTRVLIVSNENREPIDLHYIPFLIHFELPEDKETFISRVTKKTSETADETLAITFTTDLELSTVRRIEQAIGQKIPVGDLPEALVIEQDKKEAATEEKKPVKNKPEIPVAGEAFHQKKPENSKTYNYSSGVKAKMNMKKKHG
ncbi:DEAD/DEAH box helicase [Mucilaginibacter xinganensis]|uniref:RNA helicase n=1 Tax=Mucilaginibacter xinganensis TaxID=1234841 RepID=A0A223NXA0_9SPHI|nr:DEAD/DEAH box helicase [Mucilaginibacter xinganensis]ASU34324.1 RNA helicase [Mucilaginibacter xinganensis]